MAGKWAEVVVCDVVALFLFVNVRFFFFLLFFSTQKRCTTKSLRIHQAKPTSDSQVELAAMADAAAKNDELLVKMNIQENPK